MSFVKMEIKLVVVKVSEWRKLNKASVDNMENVLIVVCSREKQGFCWNLNQIDLPLMLCRCISLLHKSINTTRRMEML